ncbi:carboxylate/amino acid/amine transporter [Natronocella acetinitrilica]|uniref:Carboxylate/amino acid/amine transporter n=1 Tax=Natronocella acetinitrilica TaxID=414046 RepID=A0AAE3G5D6_9GAMM|nr:EamA family transporter [Natronocella acetinitrilica]MCP1675954.1 carboxylate/amino acid/amine transporter [Natronocella acetinitrilica]
MAYLVFVTCLWAFSFSLIGEYLSGRVDSDFAVLSRIVLAGLLFLPFLRIRGVSMPLILGMTLIGALQFGVTYLCLYRSFAYLTVPEVLLFTITTPLFVALIDDGLYRRFSPVALLAASMAVLGAGIIRYDGITEGYIIGFLLLQLANFAFAAGQVGYKHLLLRHPTEVPTYRFFGYFYLGALVIALPAFLLFGDATMLPETSLQWTVIAWLGLAASGVGLFLWNRGACLVDAGTLAVMNNALVPAGLLVNLLIWNRDVDLLRLSLGGFVILASLWVNARFSRHAVLSRAI